MLKNVLATDDLFDVLTLEIVKNRLSLLRDCKDLFWGREDLVAVLINDQLSGNVLELNIPLMKVHAASVLLLARVVLDTMLGSTIGNISRHLIGHIDVLALFLFEGPEI